MSTDTRDREVSPPIFSDEAWQAGLSEAHTQFGPAADRRKVDAIVSAVVHHGTEEMYAEHMIATGLLDHLPADSLDRLRDSLQTQLAVDAVRNGCVMLTLPREVTDRPQYGLTRIRLIVPVRRLS
jgi:hypothetical protein